MMLKKLVFLFFILASTSCNDDPTTPGSTTTTTTAPASGGGGAAGFLRGVQLTEDARTVDFVVNGQVAAASIPYGGAGPYAELAPGDYRVQFFPAGDRTAALIETLVTLLSGQRVTVAIVGVDFGTLIVNDESATRSDRARVKIVNAVPDYPAAFDLAIQNGPQLFANIPYLQASGYTELIPGGYEFELRRAGTTEAVAFLAGQTLSTGSNYTVYAIGTLRRDDIELFVARDSS